MSLTANTRSNRREENFHELDVHHVYKVGITCFWAQNAKMSLTAIVSSIEFYNFYSVYKFTISKKATSCKNYTNVLACAIIVSSLRGGR